MSEHLEHWYPVASSSDLPLRHVYHGQLWGREMAIWRADDGNVNVWENRCLHRGVRLTIGLNEGRELRCVYHGWRYANRTAGCTYIPAHPADAPARTICNNTYQTVEACGMIWSAIDPISAFQLPDGLQGQESLVLRPIPVNAAPALVERHAKNHRPEGRMRLNAEDSSETMLHYVNADTGMLLFIQPVDANRSVLRGVLIAPVGDEMALLRKHNTELAALRDAIEAEAALHPVEPPIEVTYSKVDAELAEMPSRSKYGPKATLRVRVAEKWETSDGVMALRLESTSGPLPTVQPGAHIDVHMPNGMTRQYSLTNGPGEQDHYTIGVKLEFDGQGGSACMHHAVQAGDVLAVSAPHANFPLRRDATKTILIAGGIGITPLLAMAQALNAQELPFELHYFAQSGAHLSFQSILEQLGDGLIPHLGLNPADTEAAIKGILRDYHFANHLYLCGPVPMLESARRIAGDCGWPEEAVHFEYFKNETVVDTSSSFEIALAKSALTLQVPPGRTILDVLRQNGIAIPSSCEQGACGTCLATVIEGEPDHQDVYLSDGEKASNKKILTCVSRSKSRRLVLDV